MLQLTCKKETQRGFTLLEAIVAITVLTMSGGALFGWVNTLLISLSRVESHAEKNFASGQAIAVLEVINPMKSPSGQRALGGYVMRWQANEVEPPRDAVNRYGIRGLYEVGLYNVHIELKKDSIPFYSFNVRHVGYQQVRQREF